MAKNADQTSVTTWLTLVMLNLLSAYPLSLLRDLHVTFRMLLNFTLTSLFSLCRAVDFKIWEYCKPSTLQTASSIFLYHYTPGVQTQDKSFPTYGFLQSFFPLQTGKQTDLSVSLYAETESKINYIYLICAQGFMHSSLLPCCPQESACLVPCKAVSTVQILYVILLFLYMFPAWHHLMQDLQTVQGAKSLDVCMLFNHPGNSQ